MCRGGNPKSSWKEWVKAARGTTQGHNHGVVLMLPAGASDRKVLWHVEREKNTEGSQVPSENHRKGSATFCMLLNRGNKWHLGQNTSLWWVSHELQDMWHLGSPPKCHSTLLPPETPGASMHYPHGFLLGSLWECITPTLLLWSYSKPEKDGAQQTQTQLMNFFLPTNCVTISWISKKWLFLLCVYNYYLNTAFHVISQI